MSPFDFDEVDEEAEAIFRIRLQEGIMKADFPSQVKDVLMKAQQHVARLAQILVEETERLELVIKRIQAEKRGN
jgi:hypothetical protein